jgi:hypothetical protein
MPADAQDDAPLVDEEIPAGRQLSHVPHRTSVDGCRTEGKTRRWRSRPIATTQNRLSLPYGW